MAHANCFSNISDCFSVCVLLNILLSFIQTAVKIYKNKKEKKRKGKQVHEFSDFHSAAMLESMN